MKQDAFEIDNLHGIGVGLHLTQTMIIDHTGKHCGDDEVVLAIPDAEEYDSDLTQDGCVMLHFDKSQARRLARKLWQLASRLKTADERTVEELDGLPVVPAELSKAWRK